MKNYQKSSSNKSLTIQFILGFVAPPTGIASYFYNMGAGQLIPLFDKAEKKGTGIEFKYDYVLSNSSHALNTYENMKISYR